MLTLRPLPAFSDNYIWTLAGSDGAAAVVDPGEAGPVLKAAAEGLKPVAILLTHHHNDHIGAAAELAARFDIPCFGPVDERIGFPCERVGEGGTVRIGELDLELRVTSIPGHTLSHIAFHGDGKLFCGDTLFSLGCGRLFEGTPTQMLDSLDRLAALPGDTLVCCGHEYTLANGRFAIAVEPSNRARDERLDEASRQRALGQPSLPSTIASERECNPFLRVDTPAIRQSLAARGGYPASRTEAFAALRYWKDGFAA